MNKLRNTAVKVLLRYRGTHFKERKSRERNLIVMLMVVVSIIMTACEWGEVYIPLTTFTEIDGTRIMQKVDDSVLKEDGWVNYRKTTHFFDYDASVELMTEQGEINDDYGLYVTGYIIDASISDFDYFIHNYEDYISKRTEAGCFEYWTEGNIHYFIKGLEDIQVTPGDSVHIVIELNQKDLIKE